MIHCVGFKVNTLPNITKSSLTICLDLGFKHTFLQKVLSKIYPLCQTWREWMWMSVYVKYWKWSKNIHFFKAFVKASPYMSTSRPIEKITCDNVFLQRGQNLTHLLLQSQDVTRFISSIYSTAKDQTFSGFLVRNPSLITNLGNLGNARKKTFFPVRCSCSLRDAFPF